MPEQATIPKEAEKLLTAEVHELKVYAAKLEHKLAEAYEPLDHAISAAQVKEGWSIKRCNNNITILHHNKMLWWAGSQWYGESARDLIRRGCAAIGLEVEFKPLECVINPRFFYYKES